MVPIGRVLVTILNKPIIQKVLLNTIIYLGGHTSQTTIVYIHTLNCLGITYTALQMVCMHGMRICLIADGLNCTN